MAFTGLLLRGPSTRLILTNEIRARFWNVGKQLSTTRQVQKEESREDKPVKFTTSDAHLNYRASQHFYSEPRDDVPKSHNYVLGFSGMAMMFYIIFIREDIDDNDGMFALTKPIYESHPQFAIPMLESMIAEYRKHGRSTGELQKKLNFYMQNPEAHGGIRETRTLKEK